MVSDKTKMCNILDEQTERQTTVACNRNNKLRFLSIYLPFGLFTSTIDLQKFLEQINLKSHDLNIKEAHDPLWSHDSK